MKLPLASAVLSSATLTEPAARLDITLLERDEEPPPPSGVDKLRAEEKLHSEVRIRVAPHLAQR